MNSSSAVACLVSFLSCCCPSSSVGPLTLVHPYHEYSCCQNTLANAFRWLSSPSTYPAFLPFALSLSPGGTSPPPLRLLKHFVALALSTLASLLSSPLSASLAHVSDAALSYVLFRAEHDGTLA